LRSRSDRPDFRSRRAKIAQPAGGKMKALPRGHFAGPSAQRPRHRPQDTKAKSMLPSAAAEAVIAHIVGRRSLAPVLPLPLGLPRVAQHAHVGAKNNDSRGAPVMPLLLWVSAWIVLTETIQIQIEQWLRSGPSVFQGLPWTPHGRKRKSPRTPVPRGRIVVSNSIAFGPAVTPPTTGPLCHGIPVRLANRAVENGRAQRLPKCAPRTSRRFETQ
jgi:hypothetical protein